MIRKMADKNEPLNPLYMASAHGSIQEKLAQEMALAKPADKSTDAACGGGGGSPSHRGPLLRGNHPPMAGPPLALGTTAPHLQHPMPQQQHRDDQGHHTSPHHNIGAPATGPIQGSPIRKPTQQTMAEPIQQVVQGEPNIHIGVGGQSRQGSATTSESEKSSPTESEGSGTSTRPNRVLQKRISHSAEERGGEIICPRVNCPEKIVSFLSGFPFKGI